MKKLEEYVSEETFRKLLDKGITNWEQLLRVHTHKAEEFWESFSDSITDVERKKLEKVLYRECVWHNNKYYYSPINHAELKNDGTYEPRTGQNHYFEIVKFEAEECINGQVKIDLVIDRIKRIVKCKKYTYRKDCYCFEGKLDYQTLNKTFKDLRFNIKKKRLSASQNGPYKVTYADGRIEMYKKWPELNVTIQNLKKNVIVPIVDWRKE